MATENRIAFISWNIENPFARSTLVQNKKESDENFKQTYKEFKTCISDYNEQNKITDELILKIRNILFFFENFILLQIRLLDEFIQTYFKDVKNVNNILFINLQEILIWSTKEYSLLTDQYVNYIYKNFGVLIIYHYLFTYKCYKNKTMRWYLNYFNYNYSKFNCSGKHTDITIYDDQFNSYWKTVNNIIYYYIEIELDDKKMYINYTELSNEYRQLGTLYVYIGNKMDNYHIGFQTVKYGENLMLNCQYYSKNSDDSYTNIASIYNCHNKRNTNDGLNLIKNILEYEYKKDDKPQNIFFMGDFNEYDLDINLIVHDDTYNFINAYLIKIKDDTMIIPENKAKQILFLNKIIEKEKKYKYKLCNIINSSDIDYIISFSLIEEGSVKKKNDYQINDSYNYSELLKRLWIKYSKMITSKYFISTFKEYEIFNFFEQNIFDLTVEQVTELNLLQTVGFQRLSDHYFNFAEFTIEIETSLEPKYILINNRNDEILHHNFNHTDDTEFIELINNINTYNIANRTISNYGHNSNIHIKTDLSNINKKISDDSDYTVGLCKGGDNKNLINTLLYPLLNCDNMESCISNRDITVINLEELDGGNINYYDKYLKYKKKYLNLSR